MISTDSSKPSTELSGQSDKTSTVSQPGEEAMDESTPIETENNKLGEANIQNYYKALTDEVHLRKIDCTVFCTFCFFVL